MHGQGYTIVPLLCRRGLKKTILKQLKHSSDFNNEPIIYHLTSHGSSSVLKRESFHILYEHESTINSHSIKSAESGLFSLLHILTMAKSAVHTI